MSYRRQLRRMMSQFGVDDLSLSYAEKPGETVELVDKKDQGKPMVDLLVPEFILDLARVLTLGARKYAPNNWQKTEKRRYIAALYRHQLAYHSGEKYDPESKLNHMTHVAANAMFIFWMDEVNGKKIGEKGKLEKSHESDGHEG